MTHGSLAFPTSRRHLLRRSALVGMGGLAAGMPLRALADGDIAASAWPRVAAMVEDYVGSEKLPNMVATMGWGQASPQYIFKGQRAYSGGGAVGPDTLYRIYSMTKPITGMAAMICIDEGLLGIDQPIAEILPAFAEMQVQRAYDGAITSDNLEPAKRQITVRHLLTHTAGLGYTIAQQGPIRDAYIAAGIVPGLITRLPLPDAIFSGQPAPSLAAFADNLAELPLVAQPGERWLYSVSLDLLGRVIEVASGEEFGSFLKRRIFDPCGMNSTGFQVADEDVGRLTANYFYLDSLPLPIDLPESSVYRDKPPFPFGGAGLVSTAHDFDRFLQMLAGYGTIDGKQVMSEAAVRMGTSDLSPATLQPAYAFRQGTFGSGAGALVGLAGHEAEGMFGWTGAAGTAGFVNMKLGLRMNVMVQFMPYGLYDIPEAFPLAAASDAMAMRLQ